MKLTKKMIKDFKVSIANWRENAKESQDLEMVLQYREDRKDLEYIHDLIVNGEYSYALQSACNLDTIVRDQIPTSIWKFIQEYN